MEIFEKEGPVRICAPMVRYSKLAFRNLVRLYDVDVAFSPMILADSFYQSQAARDNELTTNSADKPLIVQFAANNALYFAGSAQLGRSTFQCLLLRLHSQVIRLKTIFHFSTPLQLKMSTER